jgi:hypothetical protein
VDWQRKRGRRFPSQDLGEQNWLPLFLSLGQERAARGTRLDKEGTKTRDKARGSSTSSNHQTSKRVPDLLDGEK